MLRAHWDLFDFTLSIKGNVYTAAIYVTTLIIQPTCVQLLVQKTLLYYIHNIF